MNELWRRCGNNLILAIAILTVIPGCVGTGKKEVADLPASVEAYFRICHPLDGAMVLQVFETGDMLGSAELDWVSSPDGWKIDVSSAAGFNIVSLDQSGKDLKVTGTMAGKFPKVIVDDDGFLEVDGNFVGLKSSEVPCLLRGTLPRSWAPLVYAVEGKQDLRMKIRAEDDDRNILIRTRNLGDSIDEEVCADISWRNMLFFKSKLKWCVSGKGLNKGSISGIKQFSIKWVQFEG